MLIIIDIITKIAIILLFLSSWWNYKVIMKKHIELCNSMAIKSPVTATEKELIREEFNKLNKGPRSVEWISPYGDMSISPAPGADVKVYFGGKCVLDNTNREDNG